MKSNKKMVLPIFCLMCSSCIGKTDYDISNYRLTMKFHDDFKVMQISDIHFGLQGEFKKQLNFVCDAIKQEDPDLIVFTGDIFMYSTKGIVDNFLFEVNEQCKELSNNHPDRITKFALTYGNHDTQGDYSIYYVNDSIMNYHCKDGEELKENKFAAFVDYKDDNIQGLANYYIDLVDDINKDSQTVDVKYRLHILDSNSYYYSNMKYKYDLIHEDQLNHVDHIYKYATADKDYIGMCFFHIPLYEYEIAKQQYLQSKTPSLIGQGVFKDKTRLPYYDNDSFSRLRSNNIISYFVGHDHMNYCDVIYNYSSDNIDKKAIFSYGVKGTNQLYHDKDMIGYKIINLKDNMTQEKFISIENINSNFINITNRGNKL